MKKKWKKEHSNHLPPLQNCKHQMSSLFPSKELIRTYDRCLNLPPAEFAVFFAFGAQQAHLIQSVKNSIWTENGRWDNVHGHNWPFLQKCTITRSSKQKTGSTLKLASSYSAVPERTSRGQSVWNTDSPVFKNHLQNDGCQSDHCKP